MTAEKSGPNEFPDPALFPVVAVGASAGGLEAFTELLQHLTDDTGMAFVFIQHLAPDHDSLLPHLLRRETAMPVNEIVDGIVLSPNQIYVIPPNKGIAISGTALSLKPRETAGTAIDAFLRSLASTSDRGTIAVILSGTGSDGALGVQAIAEEGGIVFAQSPESARFDSMPHSAIATGCVDFVLPPQEIAAELARVARDPNLFQRETPDGAVRSPDMGNDFGNLLDLLRADTAIDFSLYRGTTVRRRALRRAALLKLGSLGEYVAHVRENADELHALAQDILIRVTRFFRDPEVFEVVARKVMPSLIRKTLAGRSVRIWIPGCSTGEEAYSIAICFLEVAEQMHSRVTVQIFATDINEATIETARRGKYIENIEADVTADRLARFFVRTGHEYQVARAVRDLCVFSRHDLLNDPTFSRMDMVSCRNVLIYLDAARRRAISLFHFALNPGGCLLLGKSESAASFPELFAPLDKDAKLYTRQESAGQPAYLGFGRGKSFGPRSSRRPPNETVPTRRLELRREAERIIVERFGPLRVIVNANLEPLPGDVEPRRNPPAAPNVSISGFLESIAKDHGEALKAAVRDAEKTGLPVRMEQVTLGQGPEAHDARIEITPLGTDRQHFLILSEDLPCPAAPPDVEAPKSVTPDDRRAFNQRINRAEKELAASRAHLESVLTEHEAANEEVIAGNEELQSLNEELESSKEELEASNEELTTVNQELQVRNTELENAREFAHATIDTVRSSLLVLGPDLRVLMANQSFYRTFHLSPQEVDHHFIYEVENGHWNVLELRHLLEEVLPKDRTIRDFEVEYQGSSSGHRILLLNARRFEGEERILLSIEDVTEGRRAAAELRQSQKMEAVGHLAAGVAHDFNNLLTGMIGNAELAIDSMAPDNPGRKALTNVVNGGMRAAQLTRQLLAYAGKGRFYLERLNLSEVIVQTSELVHSSIPASVQLRLDLDKDLPLLLADPTQIEQLGTSLIVNAAEACGDTDGIITVRTGRQAITNEPLPDLVLSEGVRPGEYLFLEVTDNGSGMDAATIQKIFDPFFTTKFTGRGLGLAAVLGIVRQQKGLIQVHSVPGRGSSFRVLLPVSVQQPQKSEPAPREELLGSGTILVIDDEDLIRTFTNLALKHYGYNVILAADGSEGARLLRDNSKEVGLVLLDVAMPGMNGLQTLNRIRELRPDIPVIITTGLGDLGPRSEFAGISVAGFLPKPYTGMQLAKKVKECLAETAPAL